MLRLFGQRGVRVATRRIAQQPEQKQKASESEAKHQSVPSGNDRLWNHVDKLDDRVSALTMDLGNFKGDVSKSIGELASRTEQGFGSIETITEKNQGELKADIKPLVWQVRILLGGASLVCYGVSR
ncbi:uncharacterized protein H6S33_000874 [Morchella sextelata]|uniref:uncharacterized protein n=1 Tax=Morchella sextelata TaxID=1174677 RepID=UPI001D05245C|nr:uncharacterized protein H6S33_000874 [Morchella sextelata]KAH0615238.1 hypothetical protein H6S33_000874 [Morchella sextelata]